MKASLLLIILITAVFGDKILTIATYNVENLFDLEKSGYEYQEYMPNGISNWNAKNYKIKLNNISRVIKELDADIIALQEIESLQALKDLRYTLKQKGLYYQYYKIADKKNTTVRVALLSKVPFVYAQEISVTSSQQYRNILEIKYKINDKELFIFINHWKAKSGPESQRIISAKALQKRIKEIGDDKNIILLGDFNSHYEEHIKFLRNRKHNDTNGKTGINHILKSIEQNKKAINTKYEQNNFYNLWYDVNEEDRYTYKFRGKKEALDNILISQSLLEKKDMYYIHESASHLGSAYLFHKKSINRWKTTRKKPLQHKGIGYSDHLPLYAKFVVTN
ncbi:endonuclease/exonuclease/phosphatase family protein [bacterium]|nr:endonuclease/exonuclease/phosphatase family protein [bacterium]MBU1990615.1 endonuclease/exonuclease/phosphatase family protein [bacterium]